MLHCWKCNQEAAEEEFGHGSDEWAKAFSEPGTCMLEDGHAGPHQFTPDDRITIAFPPQEPPP